MDYSRCCGVNQYLNVLDSQNLISGSLKSRHLEVMGIILTYDEFLNYARSKQWPNELTVDLEKLFSSLIGDWDLLSQYQKKTEEVISTVFDLVMDGDCPEGLVVNLSNNKVCFELGHMKLIEYVLKSGRYPNSFTLNLHNNSLGNGGSSRVFKALSSPKKLAIDLSQNYLTFESAESLSSCLKSSNPPREFSVNLNTNQINEHGDGSACIASAIKEAKGLIRLDINLSNNQLNNKGAIDFANAFSIKTSIEELNIDLSRNDVRDEAAVSWANVLKKGTCPRKLSLDLSNNWITDRGFEELLSALESENCPEEVDINLNSNCIGNSGLIFLANVVKNGSLNKKLTIHLLPKRTHSHRPESSKAHWIDRTKGYAILGDSIIAGCFPLGLEIITGNEYVNQQIQKHKEFMSRMKIGIQSCLWAQGQTKWFQPYIFTSMVNFFIPGKIRRKTEEKIYEIIKNHNDNSKNKPEPDPSQSSYNRLR